MLLTKCLCMGKLSVGGRQDDGRLSKLFLICFGQAVGWARRATFMKETRRKRPCSGLWSNSVWLTFVILHLDREATWARDVTKLTAWLMVMCLKGLELIGAGCFLPSRNEILPGTAVIFVLNVAVSWLCTVDVCLSIISLHYCLTVSAVMLGGCVALVWICVCLLSLSKKNYGQSWAWNPVDNSGSLPLSFLLPFTNWSRRSNDFSFGFSEVWEQSTLIKLACGSIALCFLLPHRFAIWNLPCP